MRRYLIAQGSHPPPPPPLQPSAPPQDSNHGYGFNLDDIVSDPTLRKQIYEFRPEIRDQVRRAYIQKGPTQPILKFPLKQFGNNAKKRAFSKSWYINYNWLEYSEYKDVAFCFYCFLFKERGRAKIFGYDFK